MGEDSLKRKRRTIIFYQEALNVETVLNWIRDLPQQDRSALGLDLDLMQSEWRSGENGDADGGPTERIGRVKLGLFGARGPKQGHPLCRKLDHGLWEMQSAMPSKKSISLLFFVNKGIVHVVEGHIKTNNNLPKEMLLLARERMEAMRSNVSREGLR